MLYSVGEIGAVVKVVDSHRGGWSSIPSESYGFFHCALCSDQHVKYRIPRGFPLTSTHIIFIQYYIIIDTFSVLYV